MAGTIVGLKNVRFALLTADTEETLTYGAPEILAPAISATITTNVTTETQYADDRALETATAIGATEVEFELSDLPSAVVNKLLGVRKNADGVLEYDSNIQAPYVAIMFEAQKSNGSKRLTVLAKGTFSIPEDAYETKGDGVSFQSKSITGTFVARTHDNVFKYQVDSDDEGVNATVIDNWFNAVYDPAASTGV
ncbi:major tail protein [Cytobacillus firmus]|uniref:major tail protein n=1 Tax=Cytobacillus firmus TaxID=1399 RepID=UPI0018CEDC24|nr:major tail protein [Cytobacillus firmus]MBG9657094.1 hypothetical protein [Cytobacillus firmus]MED1906768.1 phage tail protein [Cytobacillus firmus]